MISNGMVRYPSTKQVEIFNQLVLNCQDQAFTLAYYLSGDSDKAGRILESILANAYRGGISMPTSSSSRFFRNWLFKHVIIACKPDNPNNKVQQISAEGIISQLHDLPYELRTTVVLIDILGLGYKEAATIVDFGIQRITKNLAEARLRLVQTL